MDSDGGAGSSTDRPGTGDRKKLRSRESSKRFREKKKALEKTLTEENIALRDALEAARKSLSGTHLDASQHYERMTASMRAAVEHLQGRLNTAIVASITDVVQARLSAEATTAQTIRNLQSIIPPIAFSEISMYVQLKCLDLMRSPVEPTDPFLHALYDCIYDNRQRGGPMRPEQLKKSLELNAPHEGRLREHLANKRRLRMLLEEVVALSPKIDEGDRWYREEIEPITIRTMDPDQLAARFQWFQDHMDLLQDEVIGHRIASCESGIPGASSSAPSPSTALPRGAPPRGPPRPAPAGPGHTILLLLLLRPFCWCRRRLLLLRRHRPRPRRRRRRPFRRKRTSGEAPPRPPAPRPVGPGPARAPPPRIRHTPDTLRDLIRDAVSKELAALLREPTLFEGIPLPPLAAPHWSPPASNLPPPVFPEPVLPAPAPDLPEEYDGVPGGVPTIPFS
eukprot:tig00000836_g4698.t1